MPEQKKTTLWDIGAERILRLQQLAFDFLGKRSLSALVRHIADYGRIENGKLVAESPSEHVKEDR